VRLIPHFGPERQDWLRRRGIPIVMAAAIIFMTAINFEQGRVIEAQGNLIKLLSGDSSELAIRRIQQLQRHR
jgi:hypothetical protein